MDEIQKQSGDESILLDPVVLKRTNRNFIGLLGVHTCKEVTSLFVSIFLIAQVFILTNHDFVAVGLFILVEYVVRFFVNVFASVLTKRIRPVVFIRISAFLLLAFLIMIMFWEGALGTHYILLGAIWGATSTLYWAGATVIVMQSIDKQQMYPFKAWRTALVATVRLLFPITLGLLLDHADLFVAATVIALICLIMFTLSLTINVEMKKQRAGLYMGKYFRALREYKFIKPVMIQFFILVLKGMAENVVICVTLLIVLVLGTNVGIGVFGTVFAGTSILLLIVYARLKKTRQKKIIFMSSVILLVLVSFIFLMEVSLVTLIIFNAVYMTVKRTLYAEYQTEKAKLPQYWARGKEFIIETKTLNSIGLLTGRIISCGLIIIVGLLDSSSTIFASVIFMMMLAFAGHSTLLYFFKKKYSCGYGTNVEQEMVTHLEGGAGVT